MANPSTDPQSRTLVTPVAIVSRRLLVANTVEATTLPPTVSPERADSETSAPRCTWLLNKPGSSVRPAPSTTRAPGTSGASDGRSESSGSSAVRSRFSEIWRCSEEA